MSLSRRRWRMQKRAGYFDDPQPHKLIILGDLFDRGTEAPALQEFVIDLIERDAVILIRGNHEDLYEELATVDQGQPFSHHISNGTYDTAYHFAVITCFQTPFGSNIAEKIHDRLLAAQDEREQRRSSSVLHRAFPRCHHPA